jgi:hypothetical protein
VEGDRRTNPCPARENEIEQLIDYSPTTFDDPS